MSEPKTDAQRLAELQVIDPRSGLTVPLTYDLVVQYANSPTQFNELMSSAHSAMIGLVENKTLNGKQFEAMKGSLDRLMNDISEGIAVRADRARMGDAPSRTARRLVQRSVEARRGPTFKIGQIDVGKYLSGEPQVLSIQDDFDVRRVGSVRADTDAVFVAGNPKVEVQVIMDFPDRESVNTVLRPLMAQCKVAPVLPMESDLLVDIMLNKYATTDQLHEIFEAYILADERDDDAAELLSKNPNTGELITTLAQLKEVIASGEDTTMYAAVKARHDFNKKYRPKRVETRITAPMSEKEVPNYGISFAVALRQVTVNTIPNSTHALRVSMFFMRVFEEAFSKGRLAFRDYVGNKTFDIDSCAHLTKYYHQAHLEGPMPDVLGVLQDRITWSNPGYLSPIPLSDLEVSCPIEFFYHDAHAANVKSLDLRRRDAVVAGIQLTWSNKLAMIPIAGQQYPIVQHMGTSNMQARVTIQTTDRDVVQRLHQMKDEIEAVRRNPEAQERHRRIFIYNGVMNMMGGYSFLIGNITTSTDPKSPNTITMVLTLVESKFTPKERETISIATDVISKKKIKELWQALYDPFHSAMEKLQWTNNPQGWFGWNLSEGNEFTVEEKTAMGIILGGEALEEAADQLRGGDWWNPEFDRNVGALNSRVWTAAMSYYRGIRSTTWDRPGIAANSNHVSWVYQEPPRTTLYAQQLDTSDAAFRAITHHFTNFDWGGAGDFEKTTSRTRMRALAAILSADVIPNNLQYDKEPAKLEVLNLANYPYGTGPSNFNRLLSLVLVGHGQLRVRRDFWDALGEVITEQYRDTNPERSAWATRDMTRSYVRLQAAVRTGVALKITSFTLEPGPDEANPGTIHHIPADPDNPEHKARVSTNYPDLYLPTYAQMFTDRTGRIAKIPDNVARPIDIEGEREVWKVFAPRWTDLAIEPPFERRIAYRTPMEAAKQLARNVNDIIEPGFFYYPHNFKDHLDDMEDFNQKYKALNEQTQLNYIYLKTNAPDDDEGMARLFSQLRTGLEGKTDLPAEVYDPVVAAELAKRLADGDIPSISFVDAKGELFYTRTRLKDVNGNARVFRLEKPIRLGPRSIVQPFGGQSMPPSLLTNQGTMQSLMTRTVGTHLSMARAYPAYRVYFIEEDRGELLMVDDFYGVNCVSSIEIRASKGEPEIAILRITNVSGNFDTDTFLTKEEMDELGIPPDDESGEPIYRAFRFRSGTLVQIRLGYSSNPKDLSVVFTGKVVEVKHGPVIQLVCQGHRAELLNEIEYGRSTVNTGQILQECFEKLNPPHLGRTLSLGDYSSQLAKQFVGDVDLDGITFLDRWLDVKVNDYLRNVYISSNAPVEHSFFRELWNGLVATFTSETGAMEHYGNAATDLGESLTRWPLLSGAIALLNVDSTWDNWIIPLQPFWDAIQELARHHPGTIATVVPFEADATLFFGTPSQPYQAALPPIAQMQVFTKLASFVRGLAIKNGPGRRLAEFIGSDRYLSKRLRGRGKDAIEQSLEIQWEDYANKATKLIHYRPWAIEDVMSSFIAARESLFNDGDTRENPWDDPLVGWNNEETVGGSDIEHWYTFIVDWTADFDYLLQNDPDLLRYAVCHVMRLNPRIYPWPGGWEGQWKPMFRGLMGRLTDVSSAWEPSLQATDWESQWLESPASPLNDVRSLKQIYREGWDVFGLDSQIQEKEVEVTLDEAKRSGRMTQGEFDRLNQQFADAKNDQELDTLLQEIRGYQFLSGRHIDGIDMANIATGETSVLLEEYPAFVKQMTGELRLFLHYLAIWHRELSTTNKAKKESTGLTANKAMQDTLAFMLPPGWKVFRDYHMVNSRSDIIQNNIRATMQEMHNTVAIRRPKDAIFFFGNKGVLSSQAAPSHEKTPINGEAVMFDAGQGWSSYPKEEGLSLHPEIDREFKKLFIRIENNAVTDDRAARCLLSGLAEVLRPMYRGQLVIVGRNMKPYDVIQLYDVHNDMVGPIEIDEIVHHFNAEVGWVTTITPCCLTHANDNISRIQLTGWTAIIHSVVEWYNENWLWVEVGLFALAIVTGGTSAGIVGALRGAAGMAGRAAAKRTFQIVAKKGAQKGLRLLGSKESIRGMVTRAALQLSRRVPAGAGKTAAHVASKPHAWMGLIGRGIGKASWANHFLGPTTMIGYPIMLSSGYFRAKVGELELPVDINVLFLKGRPFVAGLNYRPDDVLSIGEHLRGWWRELWDLSDEAAHRLHLDDMKGF